jgi:DNA-binding CsgD family transcriptional regulator
MLDADNKVVPIRSQPPRAEGRHGYRLPKTSLSVREMEICKLLMRGMHLKEVALALSISIHTADCHTRNAYLKLGLHDRGGLVRHFASPNVMAERDALTDSLSPPQTERPLACPIIQIENKTVPPVPLLPGAGGLTRGLGFVKRWTRAFPGPRFT